MHGRLTVKVDVFTLDLDAGFLSDPMTLVQIFADNEMDLMVQVR